MQNKPENTQPNQTQSAESDRRSEIKKRYWRANQIFVSTLLTVWFIVAYLISIAGIEWMNQFQIGKLGLGFWMAQQGSIFVFVLLVLIYAIGMDWLDRRLATGKQA